MIRTPTLAYWNYRSFDDDNFFFFLFGLLQRCLNGSYFITGCCTCRSFPPIEWHCYELIRGFGHGTCFYPATSLYTQGAPKLTADAAGLPVSSVVSASVFHSLIVMGVVTTSVCRFFLLTKRVSYKNHRYKTLFPIINGTI